ncbi:MAG: (Fe-S)-binding protein [Panacagrimonas sp.]
MTAAPQLEQSTSLIADADLCVKCAICLPHCPTYRLWQHEGDSPRGRIALIQGLASGLVTADARLEAHLDGCVSCRRCDDVCPARVPYSRLLDGGRALLADIHPQRTRTARRLGLLLVSKTGRAVLRVAWTLYRRSGLQLLLRRSGVLGRGRLARLESFIPERSSRFTKSVTVRASGPDAVQIAVFRGCATDLFERDAIAATEALLAAAGYAVQALDAQGCCGALHQHAGLADEARGLARRNVAAFGERRIATLTSGCAATLRDYGQLLPGADGGVPSRVREFSDWLLQPQAIPLSFVPLARPLRAALHVPCTAASAMKSQDSLRALLLRVPGLELVEIDAAFGCCGAAGSHFLTHPEQSDRMLAPKLASIACIAPDVVFSSNIGCSLHLAAGLRRATGAVTTGPAVPWAEAELVSRLPEAVVSAQTSAARRSAPPPVLHPATWLAQQLERPRPVR